MESVLRELELKLGAMPPEIRAEVTGSLRSLIGGLLALRGRLSLSLRASTQAMGAIGIAMSAGKDLAAVGRDLKAKAERVGPYCTALFQAL